MKDKHRRGAAQAKAPMVSEELNVVISDVLWLHRQLELLASSPVIGCAKGLLAEVASVLEPVWGIAGPLGDAAEVVGHLRRFGDRDVWDLAPVRYANATVEYRAALAFGTLDLAAPSRRQIWKALERPAAALLASVDVNSGRADEEDLAPPEDGAGSLRVCPRPLVPDELLTPWDDLALVVPVLRRLLCVWCDIARHGTKEKRDVAQLTLAAAMLARGAALDGDTDTVGWFIDRWLGLAPTQTRVDGATAVLLEEDWRRPSVDPDFSAVRDTVTNVWIRAHYLETETAHQHRLHRPMWETQLRYQPIALLYDLPPEGAAVADVAEQQAARALLRQQLHAVLGTLSGAEEAVALAFAEGKPWKQIARELGITRYRLDCLRTSLFSKLRHPSRSQILRDYLDAYS